MLKGRLDRESVPIPKCVPMTRSSELRPLTLLLCVVPVTLIELLRRWGSGADSGSGGGGGGGGGGAGTGRFFCQNLHDLPNNQHKIH